MKFLVIAIIAGILSLYACIYVPSYIEAIPRAKTARAKSNMRSVAIELESINYAPKPVNIQELEDHFSATHRDKTLLNDPWIKEKFSFFSNGSEWFLASPGPDKIMQSDLKANTILLYDPSNGTVSAGDIVREGKYPETPPQSHEEHRHE